VFRKILAQRKNHELELKTANFEGSGRVWAKRIRAGAIHPS